jgi:sugar phosphate isomerase/epimerase
MAINSNSHRAEDIDLVFWAVGHMNLPFSAHLDIAEAGGFTSLAVAPSTFKHLAAQGLTARDVLEQAGERGLKFTQLDGIATWVDKWYPLSNDSESTRVMRAHFDVPLEEALDIGQALKMKSVVAVAFFDEGSIPTEEVIESFAAFCDAAKLRGISVDLEFIPMWGIRELPLAWEIVKTANRANSGVLVDTWHMQKGSSDFARDIALLETIPGNRLMNVQLADADLSKHGKTLLEDDRFRKFPCEGELDITRILAIIEAKGSLQSVGPEIVGNNLTGLSPAEVGRRAGRATRQALERAYAANGKVVAV